MRSPVVNTFGTEAQSLFQEITARSTEGVIMLDQKGRVAWANDAALNMHDVQKLNQLGDTATGYRKHFRLFYRNHRSLPASLYPIDRLHKTGGFGNLVVKVTSRDNTDFLRMLQIRGMTLAPDSSPSCRALVIQDVTAQFEAEEKFERTFNVNPAPAIICQLSDLRYTKVNHGFLRMMGYRREDLIGSSLYEIDVLRNAEHREKAIEYLKHGQTIPQMEAVLKQADGSDKYVIVAGQPLDDDNEPSMLFTFIDLTLHKQTEQRLQQSEERFSTAFRLAPVSMALSSLEHGRLLEVNEAFLQITGHTDKADANQALDKQELWIDPQTHQKLAAQLDRNTSLRNVELQLRLKSGQFIDCLASAEIVTINTERCILWVLQDITQRKRTEAELMQAIEAVMQDASWFSRTVVEKLAQLRSRHGTGTNQAELADLTQRELEVLALMCQGKEDPEIGQSLEISRHTVRNHVAAIYSKIGVHRRGMAIVWALERGLGG